MYAEIERYKRDTTAAEHRLKKEILGILLKEEFASLEEASIMFVRGQEIIFTAYVCRSTGCVEDEPLTVEDIELGAHIDKDTIVLPA